MHCPHCPRASVSKVFSVTEAAGSRVASGHKYKGACSRNTKGVAREIQIQIPKHVHTSANPEIQNN